MASLILLDTQVVAWLYGGKGERLTSRASKEIERSATVATSPMVALELQYLYEVERVTDPAETVFETLAHSIGLEVRDVSFAAVARAAAELRWTRDPFDRMIAAHAAVEDLPLITADSTIRANLPQAIWE